MVKYKQKTVSSSTAHAEYVAMYKSVTEIQWLSEFLSELGQERFAPKPCVIFADNESAISIANNNKITEENKHFRIKYHYVRETVKMGEVKFCHVASKENLADLLTKPLSGIKTGELSCKLGVK